MPVNILSREETVRAHLEQRGLLQFVAVLTTVGTGGIGLRVRPDVDGATTSKVMAAVDIAVRLPRPRTGRRRRTVAA